MILENGVTIWAALQALAFTLIGFYSYGLLQRQKKEAAEREALKRQNEYYKSCLEDRRLQWQRLQKMRHNMMNAYVLEREYLERQQYVELRQIYDAAIGELKEKSSIVYSGHIGVDSILNDKIKRAEKAGIQTDCSVSIPRDMKIGDGDMNILLGNLLDNAIEAAGKLPEEERKIKIRIRSDASAALFEISNSFDGALSRNEKGEIITGKADKENHGIGLQAVREIVKRYHGAMETECEGKEFKVKAFLYMKK